MDRKKGIFLLGMLTGIFIFLIGLGLHRTIADQMEADVRVMIDQSINRASPSVVGIVNQQNGQSRSTGSGVIYKVTGDTTYVVTNYHVIKGADDIEVVFDGDVRTKGTVIGHDLMTDLAVVTIPKEDFHQQMVFSKQPVSKGDFVLAIGNPLGLDLYGTITLGIISAQERFIPVDLDKDGEYDYVAKVIQTDAAINPGNSGGALVDLHGQLIGINSMKIAGSQVEGIGFSIPIDVVQHVIDDIEAYGKVLRPYMGVQLKSMNRLSEAERRRLDIDLDEGVLVLDVVVGSPAEQGGLITNDVITHFNGDKIEQVSDFRAKLYHYQPNETVMLTVKRDTLSLEVEIKLGLKR